jgi:hypothetical protein
MMAPPVWPHSKIEEIFPNIFFVTGMNKTQHEGVDLQHSRNMIIIRNDNKLSLINTVKLDDAGLSELDALGKVENVIRIGSFHGRDDAFYIDHYSAKLWAIKGMQHENNKITDIELVPDGLMPFPKCSLFVFETSLYPEGVLHIAQEGGILITCDSIKNWVVKDQFFNEETAKIYNDQGFFGRATVSTVWQQATKVKPSEFIRMNSIEFCHLLSAHGEPLLDTAHKDLEATLKREFQEALAKL